MGKLLLQRFLAVVIFTAALYFGTWGRSDIHMAFWVVLDAGATLLVIYAVYTLMRDTRSK